MSFALVLQHADAFGAGRIVPVFRDFGMPVQLRRLHKGDTLDVDFDELRVLVVLGAGADVSINDVSGSRLPFLGAEVQLIKRVIEQDRPLLALGFGAQLMAHAAGAKVYPNASVAKPGAKPGEKPGEKPGAAPDVPPTPLPEFGWTPALFPFPGGNEPIVFGMIDSAPFFSWHTETVDLPKLPPPPVPAPPPAPPPPTGNALLSSTRNCRNAAFRFKQRLFGFQYHMELTNEEFEKIFATEKSAITKYLGADGERSLRESTTANYPRYSRAGNRLLNNFVQYLKTY